MRDKIIFLKDQLKGARLLFRQVPRIRLILGASLLMAICFLIYRSLRLVEEHQLKIMSMQVSSQKKQLDYYTQIIKHADILQEQLKGIENNYEIIKRKFLDEAELAVYFDEFRRQALARRLLITALDFNPLEPLEASPTQALSYCKKMRLYVCVKGNYYDAISFLHYLEYENPKIFDMDSVQIRRAESGDEIQVNIKAAIYVLED